MHYQRLMKHGDTNLRSRKRPKPCSVEGCDRNARKYGMCTSHGSRYKRHGDPLIVKHMRVDGPDETRWMKKVVVESPGCWIWIAGKNVGYGQYFAWGRMWGAHRFVYTLLVGPVPDGLELDHLCRVRACVNPDHLEPVTHEENVRRGAGGVGKPKIKNRGPRKKTE